MRTRPAVKVLMLTQYPLEAEDERLGGIMQASYRLVRAIDALGDARIELHVLTQSRHITQRTARRLPNGTRIIYVPLSDSPWDALLFGYPPVAKALAQAVRDIAPDLVHGQGTAKYIYATVRSGMTHIVTVHGIYRNEMKVVKSRLSLIGKIARWAKIRLESHYIARIRNLIAITEEVSDYVRSAAPQVRSFEIDNAIDEEFFSVEPLGAAMPRVILFVAAITFRKGLDFLLAAFLLVLHETPGAKLRIAGIWDWDPGYVDALQKEYHSQIADGSVSFLGGITQEELLGEIGNATLLCLPSRAESAPMVISQAMAAARPVVASRVGGIPHMITDGINGRLWDVGDVPSLAAMINDLLHDPAAAARMGYNGRAMALERYSPRSVASKTVNAYLNTTSNA